MITPMVYFIAFPYFCSLNAILILISVIIHKLTQDPGGVPEKISSRCMNIMIVKGEILLESALGC